MEYKVKNVTIQISVTSGDLAGDCMCYVPTSHEEFFTSWCGFKDNDDEEEKETRPFTTDYGDVYYENDEYVLRSPDLVIMYLAWLLEQPGEQIMRAEYDNPFWAIHDAEHALYDESGCTLSVDQDTELIRLHDAFKMMIAAGHDVDYETAEDVAKAFNERFETNVSFEEYVKEECWLCGGDCPNDHENACDDYRREYGLDEEE